MKVSVQQNEILAISSQANTAKRCIAEVIVPHTISSAPIVLPMVASLTHQTTEHWITWVTHRAPNKQSLLNSGADLNKLRIVHVTQQDDIRWIVWQALAQGNSHTVVAEQAYWSREDIRQFEQAGLEGDTQGIVITSST